MRKKMFAFIAVLSILSVVSISLFAERKESKTKKENNKEVKGKIDIVGDWRVLEIHQNQAKIELPVQPTIQFDAEGKMSSFSGCNQIFGTYTFDGTSLNLAGMGATRKMCPPSEMDLEKVMSEFLHSPTPANTKFNGGKLVVESGNLVVTLERYTVAVPQ